MAYLALYLAITVAGYFIGRELRKRDRVIPGIGTIQTVVIMVLVFLMGSRIGANDEIVSSLDTIGLVSLIYTLIIMAFAVAAFTVLRRIFGFDRYGVRKGKAEVKASSTDAGVDFAKARDAAAEASGGGEGKDAPGDVPKDAPAGAPEGAPGEKKVNGLTVIIVVFMALGIFAGYLFLPDGFIAVSGHLLTVSLCVLLVFIGIDIGTEGTLLDNFRSAGWRVIAFPLANILSMIVGSAAACLVLPISLQDSLCIGSGFAWYSLAPVMLAEYSLRVSAISFMHNVFREVLGILLVPVVAKRIGYIECYCLPGSTSMDVCLPVIERATSADVAVYSFINGAMLSMSVPVLVSVFMSLPL